MLIASMKRGAYLINTARGKICDRDAVVRALESGRLAGYAGDVWFPQPAPADHPWRSMPNHGMTPHISGTSLSAQARYAAGTREILECWLDEKPIRDEYLIVDGGRLADVTLGVNWYLNRYTRLTFNYIHAFLQRGVPSGTNADVYALRAQVDF